MASLVFDEASQHFYVRFRYRGRAFKRSLGTSNAKLAHAQASRIDETLILLKNNRLAIPPQADPAAFILSDGRLNSFESPKLPTLIEVTTAFQAARIPGHKEATTLSTEDTHIRHLLRILKARTLVHTIGHTALQNYVATRLAEVVAGTRPISAETVRKEIATLRVIWNWAVKTGMVEGPAPVGGLVYPKRDEKPPFMTMDQIEHIIERDKLCGADDNRLWECLYLRREEVLQALAHLELHSVESYLYPMTLLIAHTGIRRSEAIRSRRDDFDFRHGTLLVREKKRSRVRAITFRRVELTDQAQAVLANWLKANPYGPYTFTRPDDDREVTTPNRTPQPLRPGEVHDALKASLKGSPWEHIRGFHVFRHSFASNLAAAGVDQRIIDEWMGHQTEEMRCRYRHLLPETKKAAIAKLFGDAPLKLFGT